MASNRRRSFRSIGKMVSNVDARLRYLQRRPTPRRIAPRVITTTNIVRDAVTTVELAPDAVTTVELAPEVVTSIDTAQDTADAAAAAAASAASAASSAQSTADGKNKIYRQASQPTGGTYAEGDLWFDTDDDNKFYRYTSGSWSGFSLGDSALASISANKLTAGTIDASVITVSNINAGNITVGTLTGIEVNLLSGGNGVYLNNGGIIDARYSTARIAINNPDNVYPMVLTGTDRTALTKIGPGLSVCLSGSGAYDSFTLTDGSGYAHIWYEGTTIHGNQIGTHGAWFDSTYTTSASDITFQTTNRAGNRIISARANGDVSMAYLNSSTGTNIVRSGGILYLSSSTIKIKENIEYVEDSMLDVIQYLKPVRYTMKRSEDDTDFSYALKQLNKEIGFIVEDIEEVQQNFGASLLNYEVEDLSLVDFDDERETKPYTIESDFDKPIVPIMYKDTAILAICVKTIQELVEKVKDLESRLS